MSKKLLRSIIEVDKELTPEHLIRNYQRLRRAVDLHQLAWARPEDEKIFQYASGFFTQFGEMPALGSVLDYFTSTNGLEAIERLKDIQVETPYARANFANLLRDLQEQQISAKAMNLLKSAAEITTKGNKDGAKGWEPAYELLIKEGAKLRIDDDQILVHQNVRETASVNSLREEYQQAKLDKGAALGVLCGIPEIDDVTRGIKKGDLWVHGAFPGELKCLSGDATIFDHRTQKIRTLEELYLDQVLNMSGSFVQLCPTLTSLDREGTTHKLVLAEASHIKQNGIRDIFEVTLTSGRSVPVTDNHRFFTVGGWIEAKNLTPGSWVATPSKMKAEGAKIVTNAEAKVIGYMLGDGGLTQSQFSFTNGNAEIMRDFKDCLSDLGLREGGADYITASFQEKLDHHGTPYVRLGSASAEHKHASPVRALMDRFEITGKDSYGKLIHPELYGLPENQVALLLGALWSTDGSCHTGDHVRSDRKSLCQRNDISYASVSKKLCSGVQSLLLRLGIQSHLSKISTTYNGEPYTFYCVRVVTVRSKLLFTELVEVKGKQDHFAKLRSRLGKRDDRPFPTAFIPDGMKIRWTGANGERWRYATNTKKRSSAHADTLALFKEASEVMKALEGDLNWEQVVEIKHRGQEMTYDLEVPVHHSFVVNDILTHNTTFAENWSYNAMTRFNTNVVFLSLEMPLAQVRRKIAVMHTSNARFINRGLTPLDYAEVRYGLLSDDNEKFWMEALQDFETNPTYCTCEIVHPPDRWDINQVKAQLEALHKEFEVGMIVIDHGQWLKSQSQNKQASYVDMANGLVDDCKHLATHFNGNEGVPVLLLWQINREGKTEADKNDGVYKANAFTYANNIEKAADVLTTSYLTPDMKKQSRAKFSCLKNRDGGLFDPFEVHVNYACGRIMSPKRAPIPEGISIAAGNERDLLDMTHGTMV